MSNKRTEPAKAKRKISRPRSRTPNAPPLILTVGHSVRPIEEFVALLRAHEVTCVADVRTIPRSRHNPQFNGDSLLKSLKRAQIGYIHLASLGGLRRAGRASPNSGWRNASFRGFADYMQTAEFAGAVEDLIQIAGRGRIALMCAEAVPWRCHRSLIADVLLVRGFQVEHIFSATNRKPHKLTPFAKVDGTHITYPPMESPGATSNGPPPRNASAPDRKRPKDDSKTAGRREPASAGALGEIPARG